MHTLKDSRTKLFCHLRHLLKFAAAVCWIHQQMRLICVVPNALLPLCLPQIHRNCRRRTIYCILFNIPITKGVVGAAATTATTATPKVVVSPQQQKLCPRPRLSPFPSDCVGARESKVVIDTSLDVRFDSRRQRGDNSAGAQLLMEFT